MAKSAGLAGHKKVGVSMIGASRVIQHWAIPEAKNQAKKCLMAGQVDVLSLTPVIAPDDGISNFATLAYQHNPQVRIVVQESWFPMQAIAATGLTQEASKWPSRNDATLEGLTQLHAEATAGLNAIITEVNKKLGRQVLFAVPAGPAVFALRDQVRQGKAPGIKDQESLFADKVGHPRAVLKVLVGYTNFAVMYRRNPSTFPIPAELKAIMAKELTNPAEVDKLVPLLQDLAWKAVLEHPLSGVTAPTSTSK